MTQPKLKQLVKLLKEWEAGFAPDSNREYGKPDESQPMYGEIVRTITRQVEREIE